MLFKLPDTLRFKCLEKEKCACLEASSCCAVPRCYFSVLNSFCLFSFFLLRRLWPSQHGLSLILRLHLSRALQKCCWHHRLLGPSASLLLSTCKATFRPRPIVGRNTLLVEMLQRLRSRSSVQGSGFFRGPRICLQHLSMCPKLDLSGQTDRQVRTLTVTWFDLISLTFINVDVDVLLK